MIDKQQSAYIHQCAYLPEHLPWYVTAVSGGEPTLIGDYLLYRQGRRVVLIGYPLGHGFESMEQYGCNQSSISLKRTVIEARDRFDPTSMSLIAETIPDELTGWELRGRDAYYRLELRNLGIPKKVRNMVRRAQQEVWVVQGEKFRREHRRLVDEFLRSHHVDRATRSIIGNIGAYLPSESAWLLEARDHSGRLVAFDVADFGARDTAFYMFNFTADSRYVPGASDLLLYMIINEAVRQGKSYLNLGLGIDPGVAFFKAKWGGEPVLPYNHWVWENDQRVNMIDDILDVLIK